MLVNVLWDAWLPALLPLLWESISPFTILLVSLYFIFFSFKHSKPTTCTRIADCGDYVVVINAKDVLVSGRKAEQKLYRHHTGYPGGLKEITYNDLKAKDPTAVCCIEYDVS